MTWKLWSTFVGFILINRSQLNENWDGFISYRHDDSATKLAENLQYAIHRFAKPFYQLRAVSLFRDETNLGIEPQLWPTIQSALDTSRYLLLLASPQAAKSYWVEREVSYWLSTKGSANILVLVASGQIGWDSAANRFDVSTNVLPPSAVSSIREEPLWIDLSWTSSEPDAADVRDLRFRDAVASISATLRNLPKDQLIGQDFEERHRTLVIARWVIGVIATLAVVAVVAAFGFFLQREETRVQRDDAIARLLASEGFRVAAGDPISALPYFLTSLAVKETSNAISGLLSAIQSDPHIAMRLLPLPDDLTAVAVRDEDNTALLGLKNGNVILWPITADPSGAGEQALNKAQTITTLAGAGKAIIAVGSSGGLDIVGLDETGAILRWSPGKNANLATQLGRFDMKDVASSYNDGLPYVAISNNASTIAVSTDTSGIQLWMSGRQFFINPENTAGSPVSLSYDGRQLAIGFAGDESTKTVVGIIDLDHPEAPPKKFVMPTSVHANFGFAMTYVFDPSGNYLAGGTSSSNAFILKLHPHPSLLRAFRPMDAKMAAGGEIEHLLIGPGAKYLLAMHRQRWYIWDVATGIQVGSENMIEGGSVIAALDATGERLVVGDGPRMVHVIDLSTRQLEHLACTTSSNLERTKWIDLVGDVPQPCICAENQACRSGRK
jgi:hypothetical protein